MTILYAGIDEVGRGSIFGPVFACVVLIQEHASNILRNHGIKDSKKLSKKKREEFAKIIFELATDIGIGQSSAREIDLNGIRNSTDLSMIRALQKLESQPKKLLIDGNSILKDWKSPQEAIVKGDEKIISISAASIIAKVNRDKLMILLSNQYPKYNLHKNCGYGTKEHFNAIHEYGLSPLHRKSFCKKQLK
tara:strand:- start:6 stop:581 length:576 start_codon:yes stop_codon:yes gene_type:complete